MERFGPIPRETRGKGMILQSTVAPGIFTVFAEHELPNM